MTVATSRASGSPAAGGSCAGAAATARSHAADAAPGPATSMALDVAGEPGLAQRARAWSVRANTRRTPASRST